MNTRVLSLLAASCLLSACAVFDPPPGAQLGHTWDGPRAAPIAQHIWEVDTPENVRNRCAFHVETSIMACAIRLYGHPDGPRCLVISNLTEEEAKRTWFRTPTGAPRETVWDHEVGMHCRQGLNHRRNGDSK